MSTSQARCSLELCEDEHECFYSFDAAHRYSDETDLFLKYFYS